MLDSIRAGSQSIYIKLALGAIIVVFVFWGIGASQPPAGVIAKVNGEPVTIEEFENLYGQMANTIAQQFPGITNEIMQSLGVEQEVLQILITRELLNQESDRTGIDVSSYVLAQSISQLPYFYNEEGKFDKETYLSVLKGAGQNPVDFEKSLRSDLLPAKFRSDLTSGIMVTPASVESFYAFQNEQRSMEYIVFEKDLVNQTVTEEEIQAYYDTNLDRFIMPAQISAEYILYDPAKLSDSFSITDEELAMIYEERKSQLVQPEKMKARHILITADANDPAQVDAAFAEITAIEKRIRAGEDFATVAKEVGQDGTAAQGGDLGDWFVHSQMVQSFADAAFVLEIGELSAPVQSSYGYHLILAEDKMPSYTPSLEEVSESLRSNLAMEAVNFGMEDTMDNTLATVLQGTSLADAAKQAGLEVSIVENMDMEDLMEDIGISLADVQLLMSTTQGSMVEIPITIAGYPSHIRVTDSQPEKAKPLAEVEESIKSVLLYEKADAAALGQAEAYAQKLFAGEENTMSVKKSMPFGRYGNVTELGQNTLLVQNIFNTTDTAWHANAYVVGNDVIVARLADVLPASMDDFAMEEDEFSQQVLNNMQENVFQTFLYELRKDAKVEVLRPEIFQ